MNELINLIAEGAIIKTMEINGYDEDKISEVLRSLQEIWDNVEYSDLIQASKEYWLSHY